jgi:hypothetical protein
MFIKNGHARRATPSPAQLDRTGSARNQLISAERAHLWLPCARTDQAQLTLQTVPEKAGELTRRASIPPRRNAIGIRAIPFIARTETNGTIKIMTINQLQELIERAAELPEAAQAEIAQSIVEIEAKYSRVYHFDDEDRAAIAQSDEDIRLSRFASEKEVEEVFGRFT